MSQGIIMRTTCSTVTGSLSIMLPLSHSNGGSMCLTVDHVHCGAILQSIKIWFPRWKHHSQSIFCLYVDNVKSLPACLKQLSIPPSIYTSILLSHAAGQATAPNNSQKLWSNVYTGLWPMDGGFDQCGGFLRPALTQQSRCKCVVVVWESNTPETCYIIATGHSDHFDWTDPSHQSSHTVLPRSIHQWKCWGNVLWYIKLEESARSPITKKLWEIGTVLSQQQHQQQKDSHGKESSNDMFPICHKLSLGLFSCLFKASCTVAVWVILFLFSSPVSSVWVHICSSTQSPGCNNQRLIIILHYTGRA